jgi:hypothetical protein
VRVAAVAGVLLLCACAAVAAEHEVQVFQLRFRAARDAAALVEPLLSPEGSLLLQPKLNTLTVRDRREVLARVAEALTSWDVAPLTYRLRVRLLLASTATPTPGPAAPLISGLGAELSQLFRYTSYQEVDTLAITAAEGSTVEAAIGERYHIRFTLRAGPLDPDRVQLAHMELARREMKLEQAEALRTLLRSTVSLKLGQTLVLGAARSENANQALVLVLWAEREARP